MVYKAIWAALLVASIQSGAYAGPLGLADDRKVKDILRTLQEVTADLVAKLGIEARGTGSHFAQLLLLVEDQIAADLAGGVDKVFSQLDETTRVALHGIDATLEITQRDLLDPNIRRLDQRLESGQAALMRILPWSRGTPGVLGYGPLSFSTRAIRERGETSLKIIVRGINLYGPKDRRTPTLTFIVNGTRKIVSAAASENNLLFLVPLEYLKPSPKTVEDITATLEHWNRRTFLPDQQKYRYRLLIRSWPDEVAAVELVQEVARPVPESRWVYACAKNALNADVSWRAPANEPVGQESQPGEKCAAHVVGGPQFGQSWFEQDLCVYEADGWKLNRNSAQIVQHNNSAWFKCGKPDWRYNMAGYIRPSSNDTANPQKVCYTIATNGGEKGHCYMTTGQFRVQESRVVAEEKEIRSGVKKMTWNSNIRFPLDKGAQSAFLIVKIQGGTEQEYSIEGRRLGPLRLTKEKSQLLVSVAEDVLSINSEASAK